MKKSEKEELFKFVQGVCQQQIIPQTDLTNGSDYSQGGVDACNIITKHIINLMKEKK